MSLSKLLRAAAIQNPSSRWLVVDDHVFATSDFLFS
jgi:hypothetical protein